MTWIILQFRGILSNHSSKIRTLYHLALPFYSLLCTIQANKMITRYVFFESVSLCYKFRWNPFVPLVGWTLVFFSYQKLWGTVQFSSDDMMLFLTFRPSLFVKICSCQREIQSHLTDRLWLDWIRFATFHELVERFPRWTGEISWSAAGRRIYIKHRCWEKFSVKLNYVWGGDDVEQWSIYNADAHHVQLYICTYVCMLQKWALLLKMTFLHLVINI